LIVVIAGPEQTQNLAGKKVLRLIQIRFSDGEVGKNHANLSRQFAGNANRQFQFEKRSRLFIGTHNEPLSVAAMCVCNEDSSPGGVHG
jgi:hypothetical protein